MTAHPDSLEVAIAGGDPDVLLRSVVHHGEWVGDDLCFVLGVGLLLAGVDVVEIV